MSENMDALRALIERVQPGWIVDVTSHDYIKDSGRRVVERLFTAPAETYRHNGETHTMREGGPGYFSREVTAGGKGRQFRYQWPIEGDDFEVDGNELRVYNPSHAYVHGNRAIVLTMKFRPGS